MKTIEELEKDLEVATNLARQATHAEVKVAAHILARAAREQEPNAVQVLLEPSDQGDWLAILGIKLAEPDEYGDSLVDFNYDDGAECHLYLGMGVLFDIPGLTFEEDHHNRIYDCVLDIDANLKVMEAMTEHQAQREAEHRTTTVHLGIVGKSTTLSKDLARTLSAFQFEVEGDSFTAWGEADSSAGWGGKDDGALHVTWSVWPHAHTRFTCLQVREHLVELVGDEFRVIDYVVLTDSEDYSEDVVVHGAFA